MYGILTYVCLFVDNLVTLIVAETYLVTCDMTWIFVVCCCHLLYVVVTCCMLCVANYFFDLRTKDL